jgi:hypothetical protein
MTPFDDNDLIDRLQSGIAERQSDISAPDGIGDDARRAARKRTATRAAGAGVTVLAAAGVATVLAISSGSGSTAASGPSAGGPVKIEDTAYIVKRVKAKVADSQGGTVIHDYTYASGDQSSDGSLVNLGSKIADEYDYAAQDGTTYMRTAWNNVDGSPYLTGSNVLVPDGNGNGKGNDTRTIINPVGHTYSQTQFSGVSDPEAGLPTPNLYSSSSEVQQALQSGQVTQKGTAMVNGTQAIALSIKVPSVPGTVSSHLTLYVDAQTYQPLRTVTVLDGHPDLLVADWMPATPDNIAKAKGDSIPPGTRRSTRPTSISERASYRRAVVRAAR